MTSLNMTELYDYQNECPVCESAEAALVRFEKASFDSKDEFLSRYADSFGIKKCADCEFAFVERVPKDAAFFERLYSCDYGDFDLQFVHSGKKKIFQEAREAILRNKEGGVLLDVGAGVGTFIASMNDKFETFGLEVNPLSVTFGQKQGMNLLCGTFQNAPFADSSFDVVTLIDVLEHLPRPMEVISKVKSLLKPSGVVYVKVPNFPMQAAKQNVLNKLKISSDGVATNYIHINHFSPASLAKALHASGFTVLETGYSAPEIWDLSIKAAPAVKARRFLKNSLYNVVTAAFNTAAALTGRNLGFNFYIVAKRI